MNPSPTQAGNRQTGKRNRHAEIEREKAPTVSKATTTARLTLPSRAAQTPHHASAWQNKAKRRGSADPFLSDF